MLRFLHLFAAFREALASASRAQDEARFWRGRVERVEEELREERERARTANERLTDIMAQRVLGKRLYGENEIQAPSVPSDIPEPIRGGRRSMSEMRQSQTRKAMSDLEAFWTTDAPSEREAG